MTKMVNNKSDASIIIPVYNTRELVKKNLPYVIAAKNYKGNRIKEIIIVDDASPDYGAQMVKNEFREVKLIQHKVNRGFSASVNTGARASKGDFIVLLNSDVIPDKDFLLSIYKHFKNPNVFSISFHERGYTWAKGEFSQGYVEHRQGDSNNKTHETFWVNGGSAIYRRDYWMELGGMDEKLLGPFYWEDIDLCYRAAKRGLLNLWEPKAYVTHKHETTMSQLPKVYVNRIRERNQLLFIWKNITSPNLFRKHLIGLATRVAKHPGYLRIVVMALARGKLMLKARYKEKKESKISDEAIFAKFT